MARVQGGPVSARAFDLGEGGREPDQQQQYRDAQNLHNVGHPATDRPSWKGLRFRTARRLHFRLVNTG